MRKQLFRILALGLVLTVPALPSLAQDQAPAQPDPPAQPKPEPKPLPDVVARINGQDVMKEDLIAQMRELRNEALRSTGQDIVQEPGFMATCLQILIDERLVTEDARTRGIAATDEEVEKAFAKVRAAYPDDPSFEAALAEMANSRSSLRRQIRQSMSLEKVIRQEIAPSLREVSDADKQDFYEKNKDRLRAPAKYRVRHLMIKVGRDAAEAIEAQARTKAEGLLTEIRNGGDFDALAREHSEDESSRERGGELPWFSLVNPELPFESAVAALPQGQVSDLVRTDMGFHILEMLDQKPAGVRPYEEVAGEIGEFLTKVLIREEIQRRVAKLRETAKVEVFV